MVSDVQTNGTATDENTASYCVVVGVYYTVHVGEAEEGEIKETKVPSTTTTMIAAMHSNNIRRSDATKSCINTNEIKRRRELKTKEDKLVSD